MTQPTRPPDHLPVLTEVLDMQTTPAQQTAAPLTDLPEVDLSFPPAAPTPADVSAPTGSTPPTLGQGIDLDLDRMAQRVRSNVQLQVDHLLEARLRETLTPLLAQHTDTLVHHLKAELARALDDMVTRAVAQEINRHHT
jgi:hypothetical protein